MELSLFKDKLNELQLNEALKDNILKHSNISKYYLTLSNNLSTAFSYNDKTKIDDLAFWSFLYFYTILAFDKIIDEELDNFDTNKVQYFLENQDLNESSIYGLAEVFEGDFCLFWPQFKKCKTQYIEANIEEKRIKVSNNQITLEQYEQIAIGKSAIVFAMPYALNVLSGNSDNLYDAIECLKLQHLGMQFLDDITDFKKDCLSNQFSYAIKLTKESAIKNNIDANDYKTLHKWFYISEVADFILGKAKDYFLQSQNIANQLNLNSLELKNALDIKKCESYKIEIDALLQKATLLSTKSKEFVIIDNECVGELVDNSICKSISYLTVNKNNKDGLWYDFLTSAGQSQLWVSSFIGCNIAETNPNHEILDTLKVYLKNNIDTSTGYNNGIMTDCDTCTFLLTFKKICNLEVSKSEIDTWLSFYNLNGGLATYVDKETLVKFLNGQQADLNVNGWTSPHNCVTATAAYYLKFFPELAQYKCNADSFLIKQLSEGKNISSYWWTSSIYASAYTLLALNLNTYSEECQKLINWLISTQHPDGYWFDKFSNKPSAFYTALAAKALLKCTTNNKNEIHKAAKWLLSKQYTDGSWESGRILVIPEPSVIKPTENLTWRRSSFGTQIIVDDHNRLFNSAAVLNFLYNYKLHLC